MLWTLRKPLCPHLKSELMDRTRRPCSAQRQRSWNEATAAASWWPGPGRMQLWPQSSSHGSPSGPDGHTSFTLDTMFYVEVINFYPFCYKYALLCIYPAEREVVNFVWRLLLQQSIKVWMDYVKDKKEKWKKNIFLQIAAHRQASH